MTGSPKSRASNLVSIELPGPRAQASPAKEQEDLGTRMMLIKTNVSCNFVPRCSLLPVSRSIGTGKERTLGTRLTFRVS